MQLSKLEFTINFLSETRLPEWKGSTFRGALGNNLRRVVCHNPRTQCSDCMLSKTCVYSYLYMTPPSDDFLSKQPSVKPYVVEYPNTPRTTFQKGDSLAFGLVLVGRAIEFYPYFLVAFNELGKRGIGKGRHQEMGRFEIGTVYSVDRDGKRHRLYDGVNNLVRNSKLATLTLNDFTSDANTELLKLVFTTPTAIKHNGSFLDSPGFSAFFSRLLWRITALSRRHCGTAFEEETINDLLRLSESVTTLSSNTRWFTTSRFSSRQEARQPIFGFTGELEYEGENLGPFMPYLRLGEFVHVGKGCTFGNGGYEVVEA
jgi:CRISPR-associated endoribonuclease Cas6